MASRAMAIAAFVCLGAAAAACFAVEMATDAERTYRQLRSAKDARTQLLGDRWNNLIRTQEWKSLDGKFVTTAKYVEHDPDLAWVKLRVIKGTGANRVVKDVTVPVAKLSKTCQSRVRQISVLAEKVAAAAVEVEAAKKADEEGRENDTPEDDARGEMQGEEEPPVDDVEGDMEQEGPRSRDGRRGPPPIDGTPIGGPPPAEPPRAEPPSIANAPLPPHLPPLPTTTGSAPSAMAVPAEGDRPPMPRETVAEQPAPQGEVPPAVMPDNAPWRSDYEAFRANLTLDTSQRMPRVNWGELTALQEACDTVTKWESTGEIGDEALQEISAKFAGVGEFEWEATLADADTSDGNWTERLALPPLADPLSLAFLLDREKPAGNWQNLKTGSRVRFIGRFVDFESGGDLIVAIRFPDAVNARAVGNERR